MTAILQNEIDMPYPKKSKKYQRRPKPGERRFVTRLPDDVYAQLSLLSHIEDASLNTTIIALIRRAALGKQVG